jgi:hypothetical protein
MELMATAELAGSEIGGLRAVLSYMCCLYLPESASRPSATPARPTNPPSATGPVHHRPTDRGLARALSPFCPVVIDSIVVRHRFNSPGSTGRLYLG